MDNEDLVKVAKKTSSWSGADLRSLIDDASTRNWTSLSEARFFKKVLEVVYKKYNQGMYMCVHKTATLTSIQHTMRDPTPMFCVGKLSNPYVSNYGFNKRKEVRSVKSTKKLCAVCMSSGNLGGLGIYVRIGIQIPLKKDQ